MPRLPSSTCLLNIAVILISSPGLGNERFSRLRTVSLTSYCSSFGAGNPTFANRLFNSGSDMQRTCDGSRSFSSLFQVAAFTGFGRAVHFAHHDAATHRANPHHLLQHRERIRKVMEREASEYNRKRAILER